MWMNDEYVVVEARAGRYAPDGWTHLSIRRSDRAPVRDWRDVQTIKNQLCGPEREGLELYPRESRLVDGANQFHLWVAPEGVTIGVGYPTRDVTDADQAESFGAVQRPLEVGA
jgi:hypothetical protein